jgi:hypothetical protein
LNSVKEIARVKRVDGGFVLEPQNADNCPLLVQLFHGDRDEIINVVRDMTLEALLTNIRKVAPLEGLSVRICGNLRKEPALLLTRKSVEPEMPMRMIFEGMGCHAASWGVTNFYDENEAALRAAIKDGLPFDTDWFSVKKEIQSGRVHRTKRNGPIYTEVSCEMDDAINLADTAIWRAFGSNAMSSCGDDALRKLGFPEDETYEVLKELAEGYAPETTQRAEEKVHWKTGFDGVCKALNRSADYCDDELKSTYDGFVEYCKSFIGSVKRNRGASCPNCKHYCAGIPESRSHPADSPDCGQKKYGALLTANKAFPFAHGCKFWEVK